MNANTAESRGQRAESEERRADLRPPTSDLRPQTHRWLWLMLLVPIAFGLMRLRFDVEVFDLLPANLQVVAGLRLYQQHFANARELIITVRAPEAEQAENAARAIAERLRRQTSLVDTVTWEPPWLEQPSLAAELLAYLWFNQSPKVFADLAYRLAPDRLAAALAASREQLANSFSPQEIARASYDPFGLTRLPEDVTSVAPAMGQGQEGFSSADGRFRIVFVQASHDLRTYRDCYQWWNAVRQTVDSAFTPAQDGGRRAEDGGRPDLRSPTSDLRNGLKLNYTGRPAFVAEIALGMQHDITSSVGGTACLIALLFWLAHRRWKPMLWLLTLLALILGSTLALGGLIFGTINVVSIGFAAILLGLAVDYAVVHYQEALAHPDLSIPQVRRAIAPSIFWAALTTISAFLVLNFGGLPGLGQLGTLVGLGVSLSACIMIFEFLPPLFPDRRGRRSEARGQMPTSDLCAPTSGLKPLNTVRATMVFAFTAALLLCVLVVLARGLPAMDPTANALRPQRSAAYAALDEIKVHLNQKREPLWLIIGGQTETDVARRLDKLQLALARAVSEQIIAGYTLPTPLWARPDFQEANRATARQLAAERPAFRLAAQANGFTGSSLVLTERILDTWQVACEQPGVFWPTNRLSQWIFERLTARTPTNCFALGLLNAVTDHPTATASALARLEAALPQDEVWLSGWELLGSAIFSRVKANMWKVLAPMVSLVLLSLWLAFRRWLEVLLSLGVLLLSGLCLLTVMRLAGWSWNLLNLMAIPLILGTGVDYSIFMQLALRRHHGDLHVAHRSVGRALLLCGATAVAGFGSLAWSSNAGMASLGQVCAVGIAFNMLLSVLLLPVWWRTAGDRASRIQGQGLQAETAGQPRPVVPGPGSPSSKLDGSVSAPDPRPSAPSRLYRRPFWRLGLWLVRILPSKLCARLSLFITGLYWLMAPHRRAIVMQNLSPALNHDRAAAKAKAKELFRHFALKLIDLWRYEAGLQIDDLFGEYSGWEHFLNAQAQKRGVLLVTPHLGNWELGGPALSRRGVTLHVITLAEPGRAFTNLRRASRARWNVETLVIGDDPFAFVEIIRLLDGGATVALLVDRPRPSSAVEVKLFGCPFTASIAAAELARASGCVLLPVYLPRSGNRYAAHVLPAIPYQRAALRGQAACQQLTQEIMRSFEPVIRQYLDQWYHFVPIWPDR